MVGLSDRSFIKALVSASAIRSADSSERTATIGALPFLSSLRRMMLGISSQVRDTLTVHGSLGCPGLPLRIAPSTTRQDSLFVSSSPTNFSTVLSPLVIGLMFAALAFCQRRRSSRDHLAMLF